MGCSMIECVRESQQLQESFEGAQLCPSLPDLNSIELLHGRRKKRASKVQRGKERQGAPGSLHLC